MAEENACQKDAVMMECGISCEVKMLKFLSSMVMIQSCRSTLLVSLLDN
jgi:hypothetical protein